MCEVSEPRFFASCSYNWNDVVRWALPCHSVRSAVCPSFSVIAVFFCVSTISTPNYESVVWFSTFPKNYHYSTKKINLVNNFWVFTNYDFQVFSNRRIISGRGPMNTLVESPWDENQWQVHAWISREIHGYLNGYLWKHGWLKTDIHKTWISTHGY